MQFQVSKILFLFIKNFTISSSVLFQQNNLQHYRKQIKSNNKSRKRRNSKCNYFIESLGVCSIQIPGSIQKFQTRVRESLQGGQAGLAGAWGSADKVIPRSPEAYFKCRPGRTRENNKQGYIYNALALPHPRAE